jgi:hypothetical protein
MGVFIQNTYLCYVVNVRQNAGHRCKMNIVDRSFDNVEKLKYLATTIRNQN